MENEVKPGTYVNQHALSSVPGFVWILIFVGVLLGVQHYAPEYTVVAIAALGTFATVLKVAGVNMDSVITIVKTVTGVDLPVQTRSAGGVQHSVRFDGTVAQVEATPVSKVRRFLIQ